jgi:carbon monoxide dehydrogenase subunit G
MLISNEFDVEAAPAEVYALMLDVERVAPCLPGAQVTGTREDGAHEAQMVVKLGPVTMTYRGTVAIVEHDDAARTASMLAKGSEARGQGTAQATMRMRVDPRTPSGSHVAVATDMLITGRVAQMGQGIMKDVANRMLGQMAANMESLLAASSPAPPGADEAPVVAAPDGEPAPARPAAEAPAAAPTHHPVAGELRALPLVWAVFRDRVKRLLRLG